MRCKSRRMESFFQSSGQGWGQMADLALALILSALIGLEREFRQKSAGLRTYTLVGLAAALIMLVSKYGFGDVLSAGRIVLDPSRVAAQIVTGIGFIGGGVIFMRREIVQGLTTAAIVWLTAGVGMACGAGLPLLAIAVTAGHFVVVFALTPVARQVQRFSRPVVDVRLTYEGGRGTLREALAACTAHHYRVLNLQIDQLGSSSENVAGVTMTLEGAVGRPPIAQLFSNLPGALSVRIVDNGTITELQ
jgi:putative Mg2+ transporter-C (MgtC) family protein